MKHILRELSVNYGSEEEEGPGRVVKSLAVIGRSHCLVRLMFGEMEVREETRLIEEMVSLLCRALNGGVWNYVGETVYAYEFLTRLCQTFSSKVLLLEDERAGLQEDE